MKLWPGVENTESSYMGPVNSLKRGKRKMNAVTYANLLPQQHGTQPVREVRSPHYNNKNY